jgi:hypothetical protein
MEQQDVEQVKTITPADFALKRACSDCPFRQDREGVRHGAERALSYALYFTEGEGVSFPCHRSVPPHLDREAWSPWQDGQVFCAGGLIFAEVIGRRSRLIQGCIDAGVHDPALLKDRHEVFPSLWAMVLAHIAERRMDSKGRVRPPREPTGGISTKE